MAGTAAGTVLVVGAAGAIGAEVCRTVADTGRRVLAADVVAPFAVVEALTGTGHQAVALDVTDDASVDSAVRALCDSGDAVGLVYAAGLLTSGPVADLDWSSYDALMEVNLRGAFRTGRSVARLAGDAGEMSLVFLASVAGLVGEAGGSVYCASKFGVIGFVQSLAAELAPRGIRANAVCPGNVDSPMLRRLADLTAAESGGSAESVLTDLADASAYRRLITVTEVARVCTFLLSPDSSGMSGQSLVVDGPPAS